MISDTKNNNLIFNTHKKSIFSILVSFLFFFIFYQQVFVLNIGGSFKIYELIALLLMMFYLLDRKIVYGKHSFLLFLFFVLSPIVSFIFYYLGLDASNYYQRFPEAIGKMRFNIYLIPILILVYYIFNWVSINYIIGSNWVFQNRYKLIKIFIFSGTLISLYSLYGFIFVYYLRFPDLIPNFIDFRNSNPTLQIRLTGFSAEPSSYIVMLSWIMLYLLFMPKLYTKTKRFFLILINGLVLILTLSSAIVAFVGAIAIYVLFFQGIKKFIYFLFIFSIIALISYFTIIQYYNFNFIIHTFYGKILELFTLPEIVSSSGQIRSYTSFLGFEVFKDYPLFGVGGGNSYFFLFNYEDIFPGDINGYNLPYSVPPMNIYSKVLSELGLFGFIFLFAFLIYGLAVFAKLHKRNEFFKIGFIGILMTLGLFFSVYPVYSLFLWVNIALCLNAYYFRRLL